MTTIIKNYRIDALHRSQLWRVKDVGHGGECSYGGCPCGGAFSWHFGPLETPLFF